MGCSIRLLTVPSGRCARDTVLELSRASLMHLTAFPILKKYFDPDRGVELFAANSS